MAKVADSVEVNGAAKPGVGKGTKAETVIVSVRNDPISIQALKWALQEYSKARYESPLNFLLLHVVSDITVSKSKSVRVSEASTDMVAIHLRDQVLPFLESMQDLCDVNEVVSSIEVVKDDLCPEAIIHSARRLKADTLILGGSDNTTTWGTIAHCTAPGKSPLGCRVIVVKNSQKWKEVTASGEVFDFEEFKDEVATLPPRNGKLKSTAEANDDEQPVSRGPSLFSGKLRMMPGHRQKKFLVKQISEERRPIMEGHVGVGDGSASPSLVSSLFGHLSLARPSKQSPSSSSTPSPKWNSPFVSPSDPSRGRAGLARREPPPWPLSKAKGEHVGRITVYSSTWCPDSVAVKALLRSKGTPYVDINLDIFPERRREMEARCHRSATPQVVFNADHIGNLESLLALQQEGELDALIEDALDTAPPAVAPLSLVHEPSPSFPPADDEHWSLAQRLRQGVPLQDRLISFHLHRQCFQGQAAMEWVQRRGQVGGTWKLATEALKTLLSKGYIYSVPRPPMPLGIFRFPLFDDSPSALYKFVEDTTELNASTVLNYNGTQVYHGKVRKGSDLVDWFSTLAEALRQEFVSEDGGWINYRAMGKSLLYKRYVQYSEELHRVPLFSLSQNERLCLLLNLHNLAVCQLAVKLGRQLSSQVERLKLFSKYSLLIGGAILSVADIQQCIIHGLRKATDVIGSSGPRAKDEQHGLPECEPLIHFALFDSSRSGPPFRVYRASMVVQQLREATGSFFARGGIVWDAIAKQVWVSRIVAWYEKEFGKNPRDILLWIAQYLEGDERMELTKLIADAQTVKMSYLEYSWQLNDWA